MGLEGRGDQVIMPMMKLVTLGDPQGALLDFYEAACNWELGRSTCRLANSRAQCRVAIVSVRVSDTDCTRRRSSAASNGFSR